MSARKGRKKIESEKAVDAGPTVGDYIEAVTKAKSEKSGDEIVEELFDAAKARKLDMALQDQAFGSIQQMDQPQRLDYWKKVVRLIEDRTTIAYAYFAKLYVTADSDSIIDELTTDLDIPVEISVEYERARTEARLEEIRAVRRKHGVPENKLDGNMLIRATTADEDFELVQAVQIFPHLVAAEYNEKINSRYRDTKDALKAALDRMNNNRGMRVMPDLTDKLSDLLALKEEFPNFEEAIDALHDELILSSHSEPGHFRVRPLILNGAPGIGKTAFCMRIAGALKLDFDKVSGGSMQNAAALCGGSKHYANSEVGGVFNLLAKSKFATAVLFVDEIDKISDQYDRVEPALLDLFEPESAKQYKDQSAEVVFDASHLIIVCASNDLDEISAPLLSRCDVFNVVRPTKEQRFDICMRTFKCVTEGLKADVKLSIDEAALMALVNSDLDLRALIAAVRRSVAVALKNKVDVAVAEKKSNGEFSFGFVPR